MEIFLQLQIFLTAGMVSSRLGRPRITCGRACILLIIMLIATPFILALWPKGPHWDHTIRNAPEVLWTTNSTMTSSWTYTIAIGNVDSDMDAEVVTTELAWNEHVSRVVVRSGDTGQCKWYHEFDNEELSDISLGDLDNDNLPEIICAVSNLGIFAFNGDGSMLWNYSTTTISASVWIPPTIADVLGNSGVEVILPLTDGKIIILNGTTGDFVWSIDLGNHIDNAIAVGDIDGVSGREIVVNCENDYTYALIPGNDTPLWLHRWDYGLEWFHAETPIICDIDGNKVPDILVATTETITALNGMDGTILWSFSKNLGDIDFPYPPAIADLNGDGELEVVFTENRYYLYTLHGRDGRIFWIYDGFGLGDFSFLSIGDFDSDDRPEIIMLTEGASIAALNAEDGSNQWSRHMSVDGVWGQSFSAVGDINNNGMLDIVVSCYGSHDLYAVEPQNSGNYLCWNCPGGTKDYTHTYSVGDIDKDFDGLTDSMEHTLGTNTSSYDSDSDTISDAWEYYHGFNPTDPSVSWDEMALYNSTLISIMIIGVASVSLVIIIFKRIGLVMKKDEPKPPEISNG
ncbi:MAG: FG-GAP-like repeat-containing protein [Promethearchaeota archaeon]